MTPLVLYDGEKHTHENVLVILIKLFFNKLFFNYSLNSFSPLSIENITLPGSHYWVGGLSVYHV